MIYNDRSYPYPVLGVNDDVEGKFEVELKIKSDSKIFEIGLGYNLINSDLEKLINLNEATFVTHVYCRGTMFRETFSTNERVPTIKISATKLNGEVEVDFFICSVKNLKYRNSSFNPEYNNLSFQIEKGDIIAYAGKSKFFANKTPEELKSTSGLMNINCSQQKDHPMYNEYNGDKITIMLSIEDYQNYIFAKGNSFQWNILTNAIALPCLIDALHFIETEESRIYNDKRWFTVLNEIKNKSKEPESIKIAQRILELPNHRFFDSLSSQNN